MSRPRAAEAIIELVETLRREMPFSLPEAQLCQDSCRGCSIKLLAFLECELDSWEQRVNDGERLGLADLSKLLRTAGRVRKALARNGLVTP